VNEHGYIKSVHRQLPRSTYKWKINDPYAGGVADAFYSDDGGVLFVEYKYVPKIPKRESTVIVPKLSPNQQLWLAERHNQQVPVAVVLGTPEGSICFTEQSWEQGISKKELITFALPTRDIATIIHKHCKGITYVGHNDSAYPNCCGPRQGKAPESSLELTET